SEFGEHARAATRGARPSRPALSPEAILRCGQEAVKAVRPAERGCQFDPTRDALCHEWTSPDVGCEPIRQDLDPRPNPRPPTQPRMETRLARASARRSRRASVPARARPVSPEYGMP